MIDERGPCRLGDVQDVKARSVRAEMYQDFESCSWMREEWDRFVEAMSGEIFLTFDWCRVWWKHYGKGRKLMTFVFRNGSGIVGLLPMYRERVRLGPICVTAVKTLGTDFTPITVSLPLKREFLKEILSALRMLIEEECKWDIVQIGAVAGIYGSTDEFVDCLKAAFPNPSRIETREEGQQTYFRTEANWDEYVKKLPKKQRTNARRAFRDVEARKLNITSCLAKVEDYEKAFDEFVEMHQAYWRGLLKPGHFGAWPQSYEFHREAVGVQMARGRLRLVQIIFDGRCVDYEYIYKNGNTYYWFLNARSSDLYETGIDFKWIALRAKHDFALSEGVSCIDSMRGEYDYKVLMGGEQLPIRSIIVTPSEGLRGLKVRGFRILARLIDIAYAKIWRRRVAPKIHYRVGSFWKVWIKSHVLSS